MITKNTKPILPIPRERLAHQIQRSPFVDWVIILSSAAFIATVLVAVGVYVYLETGTRLSAPASISSQGGALPLDIAALQSVLTRFDARSTERAALIRSYGAPKDPSLP